MAEVVLLQVAETCTVGVRNRFAVRKCRCEIFPHALEKDAQLPGVGLFYLVLGHHQVCLDCPAFTMDEWVVAQVRELSGREVRNVPVRASLARCCHSVIRVFAQCHQRDKNRH